MKKHVHCIYMCKVKLHHNKCLVVLIVVAELTIYNSCIFLSFTLLYHNIDLA